MREILFRGQTRRYGEKVTWSGKKIKSNWVYGGIFPQNGEGDFAIIYQQKPTVEKYPVYADTVGQYTGMTDKNGTKIFEGDIIDFLYRSDGDDYGIVQYNVDETEFGFVYNLIYDGLGRHYCSRDIEVIGNIYDNPELLEE
ncbi:YopX family protein [uncultured Ruminococcus sp.]|uniref:YopX family protein n=1 Tax=uncultured Ruminococcus sp. TaxID=165186 RepID=UPI0025DE028E|nr:YopX family protein [uncultured Ruminococcus sp.]